MARNVEIPISFEWRPHPSTWRVVMADVTGWRLKSGLAEPHFKAKVEAKGMRYLLDVPWWVLPKETLRPLQLENAREFDGRYSVELLVCSVVNQRSRRPESNPWTMREEFLRLTRSTKALLTFLNKWGVWGSTHTSIPAPAAEVAPTGPRWAGQPPFDLDLKKLPASTHAFLGAADSAESLVLERSALNYLFPGELWAFQKQCREALKRPAGEWLITKKLLALVPRREYPHYVLNAIDCRKAIEDTILIDLLRKVKFRVCARDDCRTPFAIVSRHRRDYCSQYCAHLESVRRQRRESKKAALQGKGMTHAKR